MLTLLEACQRQAQYQQQLEERLRSESERRQQLNDLNIGVKRRSLLQP
jgi:hypothetical protein